MVWYGMVWYGLVWYGMVWMYVCMCVCIYIYIHKYPLVSKWDFHHTPQSSIFVGFSLINQPFRGSPFFGNHHISAIYCYITLYIYIHIYIYIRRPLPLPLQGEAPETAKHQQWLVPPGPKSQLQPALRQKSFRPSLPRCFSVAGALQLHAPASFSVAGA